MEDIYENSLNGVEITPGRRSGNTTRIVDNTIQLLFKGGRVILRDHHVMPHGSRSMSVDQIIVCVRDRLYNEHRIKFSKDPFAPQIIKTTFLLLTREQGEYILKLINYKHEKID